MNIKLKKNANYIETKKGIIINIDYFILDLDKDKNQLKSSLCAYKSFIKNKIDFTSVRVEIINNYELIINNLIEKLSKTKDSEIITKSSILVKHMNIEEIKEYLEEDFLDIEKINTFRVKLYSLKSQSSYIEFGLDSDNEFFIKHRGYKKLLELKKYHALLNLFKISIKLNSEIKNKKYCYKFFKNGEPVWNIYLTAISKLIEVK